VTVHFDSVDTQECARSLERARSFLFPVAEEERVVRVMGELFERMHWPSGATGLAVTLAQIQDVVAEQLALFPLEDERRAKIQEVERYLSTRFGYSPFGISPKASSSLGSSRLRRPALTQPNAPLPEWRVSWQSGEEG
jgi:hypothetical protein